MNQLERKDRRFGWKPDPPSIKDWAYQMKFSGAAIESVNLADKYKMPKVFNQKDLGSCVANAISFMVSFELLNNPDFNKEEIPVSRLMIYYLAREAEGSIYCDTGCYIRDAIRAVVTYGVCPEKIWPYTISKFVTKPSKRAFDTALKHVPLAYRRIDNTNKAAMVDCLKGGNAIAFGISVYSSIYNPEVERTGLIPYPSSSESLIGGHCMLITKYNAITDEFEGPNSWDDEWGNNGYFRISAAYITNPNLTDDCWTIETVK